MKQNNKKYVILVVLVVLLVGISIAYAALSSTLNITFGTVTQTQQSWNVHFVGSSATGTPTGSSSTGLSCGAASITTQQVSIASTTISKPGDKCTYALSVKNDGTIDAILKTITPSEPEELTGECTKNSASLVCGNITYKLTSDAAGETLLSTDQILGKNNSSNDTLSFYLIAEYTGDGLSQDNSAQTNAGFTLRYSQN